MYQSEAPHIHKLKRGMEKLLNVILSQFVKPAARRGKSVLEVDFQKPENLVNNDDIGIGEDARRFIEQKKSQSPERIKNCRVLCQCSKIFC